MRGLFRTVAEGMLALVDTATMLPRYVSHKVKHRNDPPPKPVDIGDWSKLGFELGISPGTLYRLMKKPIPIGKARFEPYPLATKYAKAHRPKAPRRGKPEDLWLVS